MASGSSGRSGPSTASGAGGSFESGETSQSRFAVSQRLKGPTSKERQQMEEDNRNAKPQGFKKGQQRKRGLRFCLRGCGKNFDNENQELTHYRLREESCPMYQIKQRPSFNPDVIPIVRTVDDLQQLYAFHGKLKQANDGQAKVQPLRSIWKD